MTTGKLEPQIAKLEALFAAVTKDSVSLTNAVTDLTRTVAALAHDTAEEFKNMSVAIAKASGPREVSWPTWIAGIALVFAAGAAVLGPISQREDVTVTALARLDRELSDHEKLTLHTVGAARVTALEKQVILRTDALAKELDLVRAEGSPVISSRLSVVEEEVHEIQRRINVLHSAPTNDSLTLHLLPPQVRSPQ